QTTDSFSPFPQDGMREAERPRTPDRMAHHSHAGGLFLQWQAGVFPTRQYHYPVATRRKATAVLIQHSLRSTDDPYRIDVRDHQNPEAVIVRPVWGGS